MGTVGKRITKASVVRIGYVSKAIRAGGCIRHNRHMHIGVFSFYDSEIIYGCCVGHILSLNQTDSG